MTTVGPRHGQHGAFHWIQAPEGTLLTLLRCCPELVVGRFVAVMSFDSGPYRLTSTDVAAGWRSDGAIAYSPRISGIEQLPMGEWDEWYVLKQARALPPVDVVVNHAGFSPEPAATATESGRRAMDTLDAYAAERLERFWSQLETIRPLAWVAEGDGLSVVLSDASLAQSVFEAVVAGRER